jgi:MFS family permease
MLQFSKAIPTPAMAWIVWGIAACFALMQFAIQLSSADIISGVMQSFKLSAFGGSLLISSYYYIYVLLQIPAGILIDRFGTRRLLTIGAVICIFSCYLFATATSIWVALIGRIMLGGGFAFAFVGSLALIARWFPIRRFALMVSVVEMIGMFGGAFGGIALAALIQYNGWRSSIIGFGIGTSILAVLLWFVVRDAPKRYCRIPKGLNSASSISILTAALQLFRQRICWLNALYSGLMYSVITVFIALWGVPFFIVAKNISMTKATFICDMAFVGVAIGCPLFGYLDSIISQRRLLLLSSCLAGMIMFAIVLFVPMSTLMTIVCIVFLGMSCSSYMIPFAVANEISPDNLRGAAMGFVNTISVGTAPLLQPLVGYILYKMAADHLQEHHLVATYSLHAFHVALSFMLLAFIFSAIISWFLPSRKIAA